MLLLNPQSGRGAALSRYHNHIQPMMSRAGVQHSLVLTGEEERRGTPSGNQEITHSLRQKERETCPQSRWLVPVCHTRLRGLLPDLMVLQLSLGASLTSVLSALGTV